MRKEKYIREIRKGSGHYLQIQIRHTDSGSTSYWTQLVNVADYTTPSGQCAQP